MSTKGYVREIKMNQHDSHQTSPGTLITAIRWSNRDTKSHPELPFLATRKPMVIYSDIINITVSNSKTSITPSLVAVLKGGDINYSTALHPGDFILVNMVNDHTKISKNSVSDDTLRNRAVGLKPINEYDDGFKGLFKVQTCREQIVVNPTSGVKTVFYKLVAFGFTEFNANIYYNPVVYDSFRGNFAIFAKQFHGFWSQLAANKDNFNVQNILTLLIKCWLGYGPKQKEVKIPSANKHFRIPGGVGRLLGVTRATHVCEIYNYVLGIWASSSGGGREVTPGKGFNPGIRADTRNGAGYFQCSQKLDGKRVIAAEFWNNVKLWSILQSYVNTTINEMFTTYRVNIDNRVMPTFIARQKPFSSLHIKQGYVSKHLEMPRWKISPDLITGVELGTDEAARINYVQIFTRSLAIIDEVNRAKHTGTDNYVHDINDIVRSGLKPYITTANFDYPEGSDKTVKGKKWAGLVGDWVINGHLRKGGTIGSIGIEEPISVGDNLELDGIVYNIESTVHTQNVNTNGTKTFRTNLTVSFGTDMRSTNKGPVWPDMQYTDFQSRAEDDYEHERLLPGWGEVQEIIGREKSSGEEAQRTKEADFTASSLRRSSSYKRTDKPKRNDGHEDDPSDN